MHPDGRGSGRSRSRRDDGDMTRPILWAAGVLAAAAVSTSFASVRLAGLSSATATGARPTAVERPTSAPSFEPIVSVDADLGGHFLVGPTIDGQRVAMMVDTGASLVALRSEDAAAIGLRPSPSEFTRRLGTANGSVSAAPVRLREMRLNGIIVRDVEAVVLPPGRLGISLLGMSFLRGLKGFEISRGRLTLRG